MTNRHKLRFCLLRYTPNAVQGEFVNLGVLLLDDLEDGTYADVRFARTWDRVLCADPDADVEVLEALQREIRARLTNVPDRPALMKLLNESFSNVIQISEFQSFTGAEPAAELETLAKTYLEHPRPAAKRPTAGRTRLYTAMRTAFEQSGVWDLMTKEIRAEQYTWPGDPLVLDCAYEHENTINFFQAVSLARGVQDAKALAFSYPALIAGISTKQNRQTQLTAIVETDLDPDRPDIAFALSRLQDLGVTIGLERQLPSIADRARQDLHA